MDWTKNDESGFEVALSESCHTYWVGDDGLAGAPVFALMMDGDGVEVMIYRGPKGSESAAKLWAEKHGRRQYA